MALALALGLGLALIVALTLVLALALALALTLALALALAFDGIMRVVFRGLLLQGIRGDNGGQVGRWLRAGQGGRETRGGRRKLR